MRLCACVCVWVLMCPWHTAYWECYLCVSMCVCVLYTKTSARSECNRRKFWQCVYAPLFWRFFFSGCWMSFGLFKSVCLFWLSKSTKCNAIGVKETCVWTTTEITGRNSVVLVWDCCLFYYSTFATRKPSGLRTLKGKIHACANVTQYKSNERRNILSFFVYFSSAFFFLRHPYASSLIIILLFCSLSFSLFLSPFPCFSRTMYWRIQFSYSGRICRRYSDILHETCTHSNERVTFKMHNFKNSQCAIETWK